MDGVLIARESQQNAPIEKRSSRPAVDRSSADWLMLISQPTSGNQPIVTNRRIICVWFIRSSRTHRHDDCSNNCQSFCASASCLSVSATWEPIAFYFWFTNGNHLHIHSAVFLIWITFKFKSKFKSHSRKLLLHTDTHSEGKDNNNYFIESNDDDDRLIAGPNDHGDEIKCVSEIRSNRFVCMQIFKLNDRLNQISMVICGNFEWACYFDCIAVVITWARASLASWKLACELCNNKRATVHLFT